MSRPTPGPSEVRVALSFVRRVAALAGLLFCAFAYAKPLSVAIIPGNSSMQPTIAAVKQLKAQEKALEDVRFHVLPTGLEERHKKALADADVALVHNMGREIAAAVTAPVREMARRGAKAYAVGAPFEEGEKKAGLTRDDELRAYTQEGGVENIAAMIKRLLARDFGFDFEVGPPKVFPREGLWNPRTGKMYERFEDYAADYFKERPDGRGHVWVAIMFYRNMAMGGDSPLLQSLTDALEKRGFNVLPAFGYPPDALVQKMLLSPEGKPRVAAAVSFVFKMGGSPKKTTTALQELGVPAINVISLQNQSQEEWEASPLGLTLPERAWQVAIPELVGAIAPTVVAAKEVRRDEESGFEYVLEVPIDERVERAADRVKKWVSLRYELNRNKRVALLYYNYPPGKENIGASYLNVLPKSLWQILLRLERETYDTTGRPESAEALFELLREHGANMTSLTPGALEKMVRGGHVVLWPVSEYRKAFDKLPEKLRDGMIRGWGEPENFKFMLWRDKKGKPYFVFPAQRFGNVLFAPQPTRGWGEDVAKMYHDVTLPPHHQYLAFYLWLQKEYRAHAMVHVGTHATHEWLSGKEIGFTAADPGEVMVGDVPQVYPYIVDDVGEAIQAKRRGMATIVSHMTPPFTVASLNKELTMLRGLIDDYVVSAQKNEAAADAKRAEVAALAEKLGVLKDIGKKSLENGEDVEVLEHYLKEVGEEKSPYGLHTFGVAPPEELRRSTAEAILSVGGELIPEERERRIAELSATIEASAKAELDALVAGLAGRYITPGPGGDPIRNPDSLPTGRNLYGFDPTRMPSPGVWARGNALADKFIADYRKAHDGEFPDRVVFNLWMTEAMRHEGVTESEILALMGVKPVWSERGQLGGVEVIPRAELGRPRVDVTVVPSGLYRDALPSLMLLIDEAVSKVKDLDEDDNPIYANVVKTARALESRGVAPEDAKRMAAVRIFTEASGAYGTGINNVIQASNTWEDDGKVTDVYFNRVGNLFGQGYWGESPGGKALAVDIFKMALKDAKAAIHARSSNLYGTLDNDDVFQYLGGTAMAIRQLNGGKSPETYILNLSGAQGAEKHETLDKFIGREMRTRYTNPEWIKGMMKEGYSGARAVMEVTHNLWGWQVTTPEAVDGAKWQEMYETYVTDRNELGIKEMFRESKNMLAYQSMVDKMLVAVNKGYWQADADVKERLEKLNIELIAEAGVACDAASCSSAEVVALGEAADAQAMADAANMPAPNVAAMTGGVAPRAGSPSAARSAPARSAASSPQGAAPARNAPPPQGAATPPPASANPPTPATPPAPTQVEGFEVQEVPKPSVNMTPEEKSRAILGFVFLVCAGFFLRSRRERRLEMLDYELPCRAA